MAVRRSRVDGTLRTVDGRRGRRTARRSGGGEIRGRGGRPAGDGSPGLIRPRSRPPSRGPVPTVRGGSPPIPGRGPHGPARGAPAVVAPLLLPRSVAEDRPRARRCAPLPSGRCDPCIATLSRGLTRTHRAHLDSLAVTGALSPGMQRIRAAAGTPPRTTAARLVCIPRVAGRPGACCWAPQPAPAHLRRHQARPMFDPRGNTPDELKERVIERARAVELHMERAQGASEVPRWDGRSRRRAALDGRARANLAPKG